MHLAMLQETARLNNFDTDRLTVLPFAASNHTGSSVIQVMTNNRGGSPRLKSKVKTEPHDKLDFKQSIIEDQLDN